MCIPLVGALGSALMGGTGTVAATATTAASYTASAYALGSLMTAQVLVGGMSAYMQTETAKEQAKYQSKVDANNAVMAEYEAQDAERIGFDNAQTHFRQLATMRGEQVAQAGAAGVDVSQGSTATIIDATDYFGRADGNRIAANASRSAWGSRVEAMNYRSSSAANRRAAGGYNSGLSVGVSLLGNAANIADRWASHQ